MHKSCQTVLLLLLIGATIMELRKTSENNAATCKCIDPKIGLSLRCTGFNNSADMYQALDELIKEQLNDTYRSDGTRKWKRTFSISIEGCNFDKLNLTAIHKNEYDVFGLSLIENSIGEITSTSVGSFSALEYIAVIGNNITIINEGAFATIPNLHNFKFIKNKVGELLDNMCQNKKQLKYIFMQSSLTRIENQFQSLDSLEYLDLNGSETIEISSNAFINDYSLIALRFSYNRISSLPEDLFVPLPKMISLSLDYNNIEILPPKIFKELTMVRNINLMSNKIETITPMHFEANIRLNILNLSKNKIMKLPGGVFKNLRSLIYLDLSENQIFVVDPTALQGLTGLRSLNLLFNRIRVLPEELFNDTLSLTVLELEFNEGATLSPNQLIQLVKLRKYHEQ